MREDLFLFICISSDYKIPFYGQLHVFIREAKFDQILICKTYAFTRVSVFLAECFNFPEYFQIFFSLYLPLLTPPPIVATSYFWDYYLNRLESARLHKDASIQVWEFLSIFDKRKFYRIFSIYSSNFIPIVAPAYPLGPWIK